VVLGLTTLFAIAGCTCGYRVLQQSARAASCPNDIFEFREYLRAYAVDHEGLLPSLSSKRGNLMMDPAGFYPEYLENSCWLQCEWSDIRRRPGHHKNEDLGMSAFNSNSFCYLPWAITNEAEGLAFVEAYKQMDLSNTSADLQVVVDGQVRRLPRIRLSEAVLDRRLEKDSPLEIPIAVEWPGKFHSRGTVLFSNGQIRSIGIGDGFPMTEDFINALHSIAEVSDH